MVCIIVPEICADDNQLSTDIDQSSGVTRNDIISSKTNLHVSQCDSSSVNTSCEGGSSSTKDPLKTFSPEQLQCFQRCYEEGFDIYTDSDFKIHHPKLLLPDRFALNATEL